MSIHDLREEKVVQYYEAHHDTVNDIAVHPSGNFFTSVSSNSEIKVIFEIILDMGYQKGLFSLHYVWS